MKLVNTAQMIEIEQASEHLGVSTRQLMENAGWAIAEHTSQIAGDIRHRRILFLIGPGNNGGDGLVAARHLANQGAMVEIIMPVANPANEDNYRKATDAGVIGLDPGKWYEAINGASIILDGFFGTGRSRTIGEPFKQILETAGALKRKRMPPVILAIDIASGLDSDTGEADPHTLPADYTLTLGYPKTGLFNSHTAIALSGEIRVLDIGIPPNLAENISSEIIDERWAAGALPERPRYAHKGTFGKAMVVAGSPNYTGAAFLASAAAMRTGAGLVTLAIPRSLQMAVACRQSEITFLPLQEEAPGQVSINAAEEIKSAIEGCNVLLVGCGLGQKEETATMIKSLLFDSQRPLPRTVIDADGLNILANVTQWQSKIQPGCILTPHPGEMSRLCKLSVSEIQSDRIGTAGRAARNWNQVVVLKGACTVIASPDGRIWINPFSSPVLASAGTGDVLAGVITGLIAQNLAPFEAACLGVYLHAGAGCKVEQEAGRAGALASDLLERLPRVIKNLNQMRYN